MSTQLSSGLFKHKCNSHSTPRVPSLLKQRELGMKNTGRFTEGDRSFIGHQFLPNRFKQVASFNHKMFCGNFSKDGEVFLSASQGNFSSFIQFTILENSIIDQFFYQIVFYAFSILHKAVSTALRKSPQEMLVGAF